MACRVAGAEGARELWRLQLEGTRMFRALPSERLPGFDPGFVSVDTPKAAWIDGIDRFDAAFFGISNRMAAWMDPQQRLLLELVWQALESAAINPEALRAEPVAVFASACVPDFRDRMVASAAVDSCGVPGTLATFAANRISFQFDWTGPSFAVDSACSSGLTALGLAFQGLNSGDFPLAIVAGSNVICHGFHVSTVYRAGAMSPSGESVPFSARRDGYVRGEGGVCLVLKRLPDALRDGDPIHAVIVTVGLAHDGRAGGLTGTDAASQARLITRTINAADVAPGSIGYFEAHGTGTGSDATELEGITTALGNEATRSDPAVRPEGKLWVGSVKANAGHLEAAAGLLGIVKAALVLRHGLIPSIAGLSEPDPALSRDGETVAVADRDVGWPSGPQPRRAAVNSFGMGGALGHAVLEEPPRGRPPASPPPRDPDTPLAFPLSAGTPSALRALAGRLATAAADPMAISAVAWTLQSGRASLKRRCIVVATDIADLRAGLEAAAAGEHDHRVATSDAPKPLERCAARKAASDWLQRGAGDWHATWPRPRPARLDLGVPYPFERESHWFNADLPAAQQETPESTST